MPRLNVEAEALRSVMLVRLLDVALVAPIDVITALNRYRCLDPTLDGGGVNEQWVAVDISSSSIDYGVNEIPSANVAACPGRGMDLYPSAAHLIEPFVKFNLTAKIIQAGVTTVNSWRESRPGYPRLGIGWHGHWVTTFDGFLTGVAKASSAAQASIVFSLTHWLARLSHSSVISRMVAAGGAADYATAPAMSAQLFGAQQGNTFSGLVENFVSAPGAVNGDFWGWWATQPIPGAAGAEGGFAQSGGLKRVLEIMTTQDRFNWAVFRNPNMFNAAPCANEAARQVRRVNLEALSALNRIEPFRSVSPLSVEAPPEIAEGGNALARLIRERVAAGNRAAVFRGIPAPGVAEREGAIVREAAQDIGYVWGVPLAFRYPDIDAKKAFANDLGAQIAHYDPSATFWDKIVGDFCPRYQLVMVPRARYALVAPFNPYTNDVWQTILADECLSVNSQMLIPRQLRGVVLNMPLMDSTGANSGAKTGGANGLPAMFGGASYDVCNDGYFMFRHAPSWLQNVTIMPASTPVNLGPGRPEAARPADGPPGVDPRKPVAAHYAAMTALAKATYLQEVLRHRQLTVTVRLRYDIAPGSIVAIEVPVDKFVSAQLPRGLIAAQDGHVVCVGYCTRVNCSMDSESLSASTTLALSFVRFPGELLDTKLTDDGNPIWAVRYRGSPLVDTAPITPAGVELMPRFDDQLPPPNAEGIQFPGIDPGDTVSFTPS